MSGSIQLSAILLTMLASFFPMPCASLRAESTGTLFLDSDNDGFLDGANVWASGVLHWGEDRDDLRDLPIGEQPGGSVWQYATDAHDAKSHPPGSATVKDTDGDGLPDTEEDKNGNGFFEPLGADGIKGTDDDETDWRDADTDDDGLSDAYEQGYHLRDVIMRMAHELDPRNPDSDGDGLPDGLELGLRSPADGVRIWLKHIPGPPIQDTSTTATFEFKRKRPGGGFMIERRRCFIPDQDLSMITDPTWPDSNYDGLDDGAQDANANGRCDPGETDAAGGLVWDAGYHEPLLYLTEPIEIEPQIRNGVIDPLGNECNLASLTYQSPAGEAFTTGTLKISRPRALVVGSVERLFPRRRFWRVTLQWRCPERDVIQVWGESRQFVNGKTPRMKFRTLPPKDLGRPEQGK